MWLELGRRIAMIMLIVAFATSVAMPAVQAQTHHSQMIATVAMSADNHDDCAQDQCPLDHRADMQGTCCAASAGVSVLSQTTAIFYLAVTQDVLAPSLDLAMAGRAIPPDPHPPKQHA